MSFKVTLYYENVFNPYGEDHRWNGKEKNHKEVLGGLLILWKSGIFQPLLDFKGKGFVGISVNWKVINIYLVKTYYSCLIHNKRKLWHQLIDLKSRLP